MTPGSVDNQKRTIEQWAACWSTRDAAGLLPLLAPDVVYEDVPMGVMKKGAEEVRAFAEDVFSRFPDISFDLQSSVADGTGGAAEWIMRGRRYLSGMPAAGAHVEVRGVSIFEFAGDRIRRCSDYWDMATYLKQLSHVQHP